jgi:hypothetical protein
MLRLTALTSSCRVRLRGASAEPFGPSLRVENLGVEDSAPLREKSGLSCRELALRAADWARVGNLRGDGQPSRDFGRNWRIPGWQEHEGCPLPKQRKWFGKVLNGFLIVAGRGWQSWDLRFQISDFRFQERRGAWTARARTTYYCSTLSRSAGAIKSGAKGSDEKMGNLGELAGARSPGCRNWLRRNEHWWTSPGAPGHPKPWNYRNLVMTDVTDDSDLSLRV